MRWIALLLLAAPLFAQRPLRILIVDGVNNHDWQAGTRGIQEILAESKRFTVDVSTTPADLSTWHPRFSSYAVLIL